MIKYKNIHWRTRRVCTALGGGFSHVAWDSVAADIVPRVGWDAELLTKVLWRGVEYTYKCLGIGWKQTEDNSVSQMLYEQTHKQHDGPEPAFYYYTDHCGSREQSKLACFAEMQQCRRRQHLGSTALLIDDSGRVVQELAYMPYGEDWVDDSRISYSDTTRIGVYQFNGKERDYESGFLYYGARYYCPELWTGWTTPDPMMDRYPGLSPYNYCNLNPVILVDPDGMDTLVFNKCGNYSHTIQAEGEHVGRYEQPSGNPYTFTFADPVNDPIEIERKKITRLQIVKEDDIKVMLSNAGVFDDKNRENRVAYAMANGNKELDFAMKPNRGMGSVYGEKTYKSIYLVDGVAHNPANFGNFLYGAACEALGFSLFVTKLGAHYNSRFGDANKNGYSHQWDSQDDQFSINCGYRHAKNRGYHNINHNWLPGPCLP